MKPPSESKAGASCRPLSVSPPSVPSVVDMSAAPTPAKLVEKSLHAFGFHGRKRHPVNSRGSVVGLGQPIGFPERLPFANVDIQPPEPPRSVQPSP